MFTELACLYTSLSDKKYNGDIDTCDEASIEQ